MYWKVGKVKITKIVELETVGSTRFILPLATNEEIRKSPWLVPHFATDEGRLRMSVHSLVMETPDRRIVVDTGPRQRQAGPQRAPPGTTGKVRSSKPCGRPALRPTASTPCCAPICTSTMSAGTPAWSTAAGCRPSATRVTCSAGTEYEYWRDHSEEPDKVAVFNDSVKPVVDAGKADLVAGDARVADEITLIPTPGHSPGHMSLHIRSDGEEALLTGDVAHHPCQMAHLDWSSTADSDPVQSAQTRRELFGRFADTATLVIGGHFNAGHIRRDGGAFKFIV